MDERVAFLTTSYPRYEGHAAGHFVASEASRWAQMQARVVVIAPGASTWSNPGVCYVGVPDYGGCFGWPGALPRLRAEPSRILAIPPFVALAAAALLRYGPFERVIAHWLVPMGWPIASGFSNRAANVEVVVHGSDLRLLMQFPRWLSRQLLQQLHHRGAQFRVVSQAQAASLEAICPRVTNAIRVAPSPIDVTNTPNRHTCRVELCGADVRPLIVLASRLIPEKSITDALLATRGLTARVVVLGDGPEGGKLRALFPTVEFMGHTPHPDTLRWLRAAHLVLNASPYEGAPTVIREARALGTRVLSVPCGDVLQWASQDPDLRVVLKLTACSIADALAH